jgi:hypothetical protein
MQRSSNGNDPDELQGKVPAYCPPPPYEPSAALPPSCVLPSVPLRKRDMNKLGLTVITDIPMDAPFECRPLEIGPGKRWRGRGRDVWERKPLGASVRPEHM